MNIFTFYTIVGKEANLLIVEGKELFRYICTPRGGEKLYLTFSSYMSVNSSKSGP